MFGKKSALEGKSARELYGKPLTPKQIVAKQCKENNAKGGKKSK